MTEENNGGESRVGPWSTYMRDVMGQLRDRKTADDSILSKVTEIQVTIGKLEERLTSKALLIGLLGGLVPVSITVVLYFVFRH